MRVNVKPDFESQKSTQFTLHGIRCYIQASKVKKGELDYFRVFLWIHGDDMYVDVGRKIDLSFTLVSTIASLTHEANDLKWDWRFPTSYGFDEFIPWNDLNDVAKGFVVNHKALLKITLEIKEPEFKDYN